MRRTRAIRAARGGTAVVLAAVLGLVGTGIVSAQDPTPAPPAAGAGQPGPAADRVFFKSFFVDRAPLELQAGSMDLYLFGLRTEAAQQLQDAEGIQLFKAPATTLSLILNPAPAPEGELNPFWIPEVRQAMQYLVDREFIARDIYQGLAQPMVAQVGPSDFDFLTVYGIVRGSDIRYDPEFAHQLITTAMTAAGAELVDGTWHFGGELIRLKFITRVEDERREIGDLVGAALKGAGFEVQIVPQSFAPAILSVYSTDPKAFEWHLYTEGWGRGSAQRYDDSTINAMTAPWLGNMPGWREQGFWQFENAELDTLGKQLFRGEFNSLDERNDIYRRMTQLGLDASVRVWLASVTNSFPATDTLTGVTQDVVSGPRSPWTLRSAHVPGTGDLTVGHLWVWTERTTWNPVGGFGDVYSVDIWKNLNDPPLWNHPFTGTPEPFRAGYKVETGGPDGTLEVPSDAVLWDAVADRWVPVLPGAQAVSKVTFDYTKYFASHWHDGQPITMADAAYSIAQGFELAYDPDKARIEIALAATSIPYLDTFRGFRILDDARLEVYVDYWHFDTNSIAAYASPTSLSMPWEILAAMDDLVFDKRRAAYSDTSASRSNVPWLSLVTTRHARLVDGTLRKLSLDGTVPAGVFEMGGSTLVTPDDAKARYDAAHDWFTKYQHLVISNGPYFLALYDPPAQFAELDAFRDPTYPYTAGDFDIGAPPQLAIGEVEGTSVTIGQASRVSVRADGAIAVQYLLIDPATGKVVDSGDAAQGEVRGQFSVTLSAELTSTLFPGLYDLYLAASSNAVALVSERRVQLEVSP